MRWLPLLLLCIAAGCVQPDAGDDGDEVATDRSASPGASSPASSPPSTTPPPGGAGDGAGFGTIERGNWGPDREARELRVLDDEAAWAAFWDEMNAGQSPPPERPDVDFDTRFVVAVLDQTRPSTGYAVSVYDVEAGDRFQVHTTFTRPGDGCGTGAALTQPHHIVWVARVGDGAPQADLVAHEAATDCTGLTART